MSKGTAGQAPLRLDLGDRIRAALAPWGSRSALSTRVAVLYLPVSVASQLIDAAGYGGPLVLWMAASSVAFAVLVGGLAIARRLVGARPRPLTVLGILAILGLARSISVAFTAMAFGLRPHLDLGLRLAGGLVTNPALLALMGYVVSRHDEHRALVADLVVKREALLTTERTMDEELSRSAAELAKAVRISLQPAIDSVTRALKDAAHGAPSRSIVAALADLVEGEVRPLSHRLLAEDVPPTPIPSPGPSAARPRVPIPARFPVAAGLQPALAMVLVGASVVTPGFRDFTTFYAVVYVVAHVAWAGIVLAAVRRMVGRLTLPTPLTFTVVVTVYSAIPTLYVPLAVAVGARFAVGTAGNGQVLFALLGALTVTLALVDAQRAATEEDLATTVDRLERSVALVRRRARLARRRLAQLLHGSLQGSLYAAALRVAECDSPPRPELISAVRADIESALRRLDAPAADSGTRLSQTLAEILGTWGDQRSITAEVKPSAAKALSGDRDAEEAVAVVVREAVTNALRHGRAQRVAVLIELAGDGQRHPYPDVQVIVRDDGHGWEANGRAGLGTALFDELCRAWNHDSDATGTTFRALVTAMESCSPSPGSGRSEPDGPVADHSSALRVAARGTALVGDARNQ